MASPANPTGTMLGRDDLAALVEAAQAAGTQFISDEIYHGIEYEAKAVSALESPMTATSSTRFPSISR